MYTDTVIQGLNLRPQDLEGPSQTDIVLKE